jgi:NADH-quinone oxidoreductase subunit N
MNLFPVIWPELILAAVACVLFLVGVVNKPGARWASALITTVTLVVVFVTLFPGSDVDSPAGGTGGIVADALGNFRVSAFGHYIKTLAAGVGIILSLLFWPSNDDRTGNGSLNFGTEAGEFFALMLLSIAGIFVVAGANDIILLFLGIELASIPTYIMVSVSRPLPVAQEAGVKYFFLGALAAAVLLFGFSYLYGTTGVTSLDAMTAQFNATIKGGASAVTLTSWQTLAVVMLIVGFAFKMAAVPMHFYAGDVYQGAATPLTALLSFVPKITGFVALIKLMFVIGGGVWAVPADIAKLIWVLAILTMTVGNTLGLLQQNVKRTLAYSSIAHSGYMLVGVAALVGQAGRAEGHEPALRAVLFYLAAYGLMNAAAFGVLMLLPAKAPPAWERSARRRVTTGSAETFEDIAGAGIEHVGLGLAMAVACFSLIGIPLTVGFFGKFYLIQAAWTGGMTWLVILMMINAAIGAAYYLRIVATMFLRPEPIGGVEPGPTEGETTPLKPARTWPILASIFISCIATLLFGTYLPATTALSTRVTNAATVDRPVSSAALTAGSQLSAQR